MEGQYILGIDQGSTGSKVLIVDSKGELVCSAYRKIESFYPNSGWLEHDPVEIWQSVKECLVEVSERFDLSLVRAVGLTNQRETTILWERATGRPLTPAVSWQCTRSQEIINRWMPMADEILRTTGLVNNTYFSASKIVWLLENYSGLRERCEKGEVCFGNINTWILWNLSAGKSHLTDSSNAGRTMFFNAAKNEWSEELIDRMGIPRKILPSVIACDGDFGMAVEPAEVFKKPLPICASVGDQMSALFGQACFESGEAKCTIGTSLNLVTYTGEYLKPRKGLLPAIACNLSGEMTYELEGGVNVAGSVYEWLNEQLGFGESYKDINAMAEQVQSDGVYFVPAFGGLLAPHWNSGARALMIGMDKYHDKRHICRAAVESIALQANDVVEVLRKDFHINIRTLKVDGGVAKSDFVMQIFADVLNCRIERPANADSTPMGAVYIAGLASGLWKDKGEIRSLWKLDKAFEPKTLPEDREKLLAGWNEAVKRSFDWIK